MNLQNKFVIVLLKIDICILIRKNVKFIHQNPLILMFLSWLCVKSLI
jgi:hypothetical protein